MMLTKLGKKILLACGLLFALSLKTSSSLLHFVLGLVLALFVLNILEARRCCRSVRIRPPSAVTCFEGDHLSQPWEILNVSKFSVGCLFLQSQWGALFQVAHIEAQTLQCKTPSLCFSKRGVFPFKDLFVASTYPFGLVRMQHRLKLTGEIIVYPKPYECRPPSIGGFEPVIDGCITGKNFSRSGDRFRGVRPLRNSDPIKLIHWKSSAKGLGLMAKEFDETLSGRVGLILDVSGIAKKSEQFLIDAGARAIASLMLSTLDQGHQVEYCVLGEKERLSVPPFSGGEVVLESLARVYGRAESLNEKAILESLAVIPAKASIALILTVCPLQKIQLINKAFALPQRKVNIYIPSSLKDLAPEFNFPVDLFEANAIMESGEFL